MHVLIECLEDHKRLGDVLVNRFMVCVGPFGMGGSTKKAAAFSTLRSTFSRRLLSLVRLAAAAAADLTLPHSHFPQPKV